MADFIFDHPEYDGKEYQASKLLSDYLRDNGFEVEMGVGGYETSFRLFIRTWKAAPPSAFCANMNALVGLGHGCGHHMQGPACLGAAMAIKETCKDKPYRLVVYGTPAEETQGRKGFHD